VKKKTFYNPDKPELANVASLQKRLFIIWKQKNRNFQIRNSGFV